jgi:hypothetical protein
MKEQLLNASCCSAAATAKRALQQYWPDIGIDAQEFGDRFNLSLHSVTDTTFPHSRRQLLWLFVWGLG